MKGLPRNARIRGRLREFPSIRHLAQLRWIPGSALMTSPIYPPSPAPTYRYPSVRNAILPPWWLQ